MEILSTIVPIFAIVLLGWAARRGGFMPPEFLGPANRLVYYFAIPALIFGSIAKASLRHEFRGTVLFITLACVAAGYACAWMASRLARFPAARAGAFIASAGHGNLGYVGLAVAYYFMGDSGLARAGLLAGFLTVLQNTLSVLILQAAAPLAAGRARGRETLRRLATNPVILSALAGILVSALGIPLPLVVRRSVDMLSGLAPPTALLLIGASLTLDMLRAYWRPVLGAVVIKLAILPGIGLLVYRAFGLPPVDFLPGLILLAAPTATVTYVMAREMRGDAGLAVAAISASTLLSAVSYSAWLLAVGPPGGAP
jgi:hypothetical protein